MKKVFLATLILVFSFQAHANELAGELSDNTTEAQTAERSMHFTNSDFNSIFVDLTLVAGLLFIGKKMKKDKELHLYAGAITGRVASTLCGLKRFNVGRTSSEIRHRKFWCSCGAATAVGVLKEVRDKVTKKGTPEFADALITSAGGCAVGTKYVL